MTRVSIEHHGHDIRAEVDGEHVRIWVDGEDQGSARWRDQKIVGRPSVLTFARSVAVERETRIALQEDESEEVYARLETAIAGQEELI